MEMNEKEIESYQRASNKLTEAAMKAAKDFLANRDAYCIYPRVTSLFNYGGSLCDGPYAMLEASFIFKAEDLASLLGNEELARITVRRYDVPGFNDGRYLGSAKLMYSYKKDKAYFFGG